jgi:hypothetical protein
MSAFHDFGEVPPPTLPFLDVFTRLPSLRAKNIAGLYLDWIK